MYYLYGSKMGQWNTYRSVPICITCMGRRWVSGTHIDLFPYVLLVWVEDGSVEHIYRSVPICITCMGRRWVSGTHIDLFPYVLLVWVEDGSVEHI